MIRRWALTALLGLAQACAQRPWITEAETGNLANLHRYVEVAAARQQFDQARLEHLAEAVAAREIATADDADAYERILALGPCASALFWPLRRHSLRSSETGAAAALLLLDQDLIDSSQGLRALRGSSNGAWRAVGVRASQSPSLRHDAYGALVDPDPRVRRAGLMTLEGNASLQDGSVLFDVVRLDPEDSLRARALAILGETADIEAMLPVRELWDQMQAALTLAGLQALDSAPLRRTIGPELLSRILQSSDSMTSLVAATLLYRGPRPVPGAVRGRVVRALRHGSSSEQLVALATLGAGDEDAGPEIAQLAREGAPHVRVVALELLVQRNYDVNGSLERLRGIADSREVDAKAAQRALALMGDARSLERLKQHLTARSSMERLDAARVFVRLKQWNAVALALTDDHPEVRLATACDVLAG